MAKCPKCGKDIIPLSMLIHRGKDKFLMWFCSICQTILGITNEK